MLLVNIEEFGDGDVDFVLTPHKKSFFLILFILNALCILIELNALMNREGYGRKCLLLCIP
jgi:hypothetical protein